MAEELRATVVGTLFRNPENAWSVVEVRTKGDQTTVVGSLPELSPGESCVFGGIWTEHPQYGRQFKASTCSMETPTTLKGIERYLGSGLIKGVGPSTARLIVQAFGLDTLEVLSEHPERLMEVSGIGRTRFSQISASFIEQRSLRRTLVFLQTYGLSPALSVKISKRYQDKAERVIRANPYQLIDDIQGVGFLTADKIALSLGFPQDGEYRLRSGIKYVLRESSLSQGHTWLPRELLLDEASALLRAARELLDTALYQLLLLRELIAQDADGTEAVFLPDAFACEKEIARRLLQLNQFSRQMMPQQVRQQIAAFERDNHITFSKTQRDAVLQATQSGVLVITGGPGTGKTTLINCVLAVLGEQAQTLLAAPTGRAAKRMSEATGREAKTIHRLLEFSGEEGQFLHDQDDPLDCSCLIVDEMSMVDIFLMRSLLRALKAGTRLILVGDKDQLPSVGPGNVLGDILASGRIAQVRLTEIFRQEDKSMIVHNAHLINAGLQPILNRKDGDFFFERKRTVDEVAGTIVDLCISRLPAFLNQGDSGKCIQVLSPTKKGGCGVHQLNKLLQQALNPAKDPDQEIVYGETAFRQGDKVIHVRNNYSLPWMTQDGAEGQGVFNGDVGYIQALDAEGRTLDVLFDDERTVTYEYAQLEELELAYCLSVHKSQGSEFEAVVMPVVGGHQLLLNRNLFYTAVTRARRLVVLVGYEEAIAAMVHNDHHRARCTMLAQRLMALPAADP
ncbi:MAG: ATP-dependent RecD-like DNA helicase [Christensenellales bacterium]